MPGWIIDLERHEIRDGSGEHARLQKRQFDVLVYLAHRHDRLVPKDELIAANWPGVAVSDDSLTKCVSEIRRALGADRGTLKTVAGRGYMLTGWRRDGQARLVIGPTRGWPHLPPARPLVGRQNDVARVAGLTGRRELVTITGSGGVGKTSLAVEAARQVAADFADGVFVVRLAPLLAGGSVAAAIVATLGIASDADPLAAVLAHLGGKRALLVLDNCEHVIEDAAVVAARLLAAGGGLRLLATSREPLAIDGEAVVRLEPLAYPPSADGLDAGAARSFAAIELLARRLALVADGYEFGDADVPAAVEICRRLEGIPLALVLAAAQFRAMRLDEVARRLDRPFDLLAGGARDVDARQRSLRAAIGWSVDLLDAGEQALFAQIATFAAPATMADIEAVCRIDGGPPTAAGIVALADKSLLGVHRDDAGPTRYGYFSTIRQFALDRGSDDGVNRRHAAHLAGVMRRGATELEVSATETWRDAYRPYLDDLRAAFAWSLSPGGSRRLAVELVVNGAPLLEELSLQPERRAWIERIAAMPEAAETPGLDGRVKLWRSLLTGWVIWDGGLSHEAAAQFALSGESFLEGRARAAAAASDVFIGAWERVWPGFDAAEALLRPAGATRSLSNMLRYKATSLIRQQRLGDAMAPLEEAGRIADAIGYFTGSVRARATFGEIAFEEGDMAAAIASSVAELAEVSGRGSLSDVQSALTNLAAYRLLGGEVAAAADTLLRAFAVDRRLGDRWAASLHFELAAFYLALRGDLGGAAMLAGLGKTLSAGRHRPPERFEQVVRDRMDMLLAHLPADQRDGAAAPGWSVDQAVSAALERLALG